MRLFPRLHLIARLKESLRRPIVFVHVPKTAGTALTNYLSQGCRSAKSKAPPFVGDYSIYSQRAHRWSLIAGHFTYSRMRDLVPNADFFTVLREPVARSISLYRSWADPSKMSPQWRDVMTESQLQLFEWIYKASFEEFVMSDHPHIVDSLSNNLTRLLSSDGTADATSALNNLQTRFATFGIQEAFDDTIQLMQEVWPWLGPYRARPTDENRSRIEVGNVTSTMRRRLEDLNAIDLEFYDAATKLFQRNLARRRAG